MNSSHPTPNQLGPQLCRSIKREFHLSCRALLRHAIVEDAAGMFRAITGLPHPFANSAIVEATPTPAMAEASIEGLCRDEFPASFMSTEPLCAEAEARLFEHGFVTAERMPLMSIAIEDLETPRLGDGNAFEEADESADAEWCEALAIGYELPLELVTPMGPATALPADDLPLRFFLVRQGDTPVATAMISTWDEVIGVHCVATHPDHRGRGLGAHVTAAAVNRVAEESDHRTAVLQSSLMGASVYRRLGFVDHGTMPMLVRMPAGAAEG